MRDFWLFPFKQKKKLSGYIAWSITAPMLQWHWSSLAPSCAAWKLFFFFFPPSCWCWICDWAYYSCVCSLAAIYLLRDLLLLSFDRSICILKTWVSVVCNHVFGIKWIMIGLFFSEWYELDWVTLVAGWNCVVELQRVSKPTF